jgi:hypothetical protein
LVREFMQLTPPESDPDAWRADLDDLAARLTECCRGVDPTSTDRALEEIEGELAAAAAAE